MGSDLDGSSRPLDLSSTMTPSRTKNLCYRHRPDLVRKHTDDAVDTEKIQKQVDLLPVNHQADIGQVWSIFSAATPDERILMLRGLLNICCMSQLSFISNTLKPLLRIDFSYILPREVSLRIFSYLDAKSLCHAAQVSRQWKALADDDTLWHRMCEQHIDKKCTKCGWGLPLLDKKRSAAMRKRPAPIRPTCTTDSPTDLLPNSKKRKADESNTEPRKPENNIMTTCPTGTVVPRPHRRLWKDVYSERLIVERNWRNGNYQLRTLSGHKDGVMCVQFCDGLNVIITGSYDKTVRVWDMTTGEQLRVLDGHTRCVRALQFDEAKLVTGGLDNSLKIWNWHTGECIRTLTGHTDGVLCLHFDCQLLVSGSKDNTIRLWNFIAGECCTLRGHTDFVNSVRITNDSTTIISASDDTTIRLWDIATKTCTHELKGHVGQVQMALPSPGFAHPPNPASTPAQSSNALASLTPACATNYAPNLSTTTSRPLEHDTPILLSCSLDNTIKVWDMTDGYCLHTLFGHVEGIWSIAADKLRIVSGSQDKTVRIWDPESGRCMWTLDGHEGPVTAVALSDTKIVSTSEDGQVRIWDYSKRTA